MNNRYYISIDQNKLIEILEAATSEKVKKINVSGLEITTESPAIIEIEIDRNHIREREKNEQQ